MTEVKEKSLRYHSGPEAGKPVVEGKAIISGAGLLNALDVEASTINEEMKRAASLALQRRLETSLRRFR